MTLEYLLSRITDSSQKLIDTIQSDEAPSTLGLRRSARLPVLAALLGQISRPILLLTDRADRALTLSDELAMWAPQVPRLFFSEPTPLFYENAPWGENTRRNRLLVLNILASYHIPGAAKPPVAPVIIAPARALMARTLPRREFLKATQTLKQGQVIQPEALARNLVDLGYETATTVIAPGQFARRGGILDIWPPAQDQPARIEFFGDEIDTMRSFNPATQRTYKGSGADSSTKRIQISPAREFVLSAAASVELHTMKLDDESKGSVESGQAINEYHIPLLYESQASLLDYLPRQALVLIDNRQILEDTVNDIEEQAVSLRRDYIQEGSLPKDFPVPYLPWIDISDSLESHTTIELGPSSEIEGIDLAQRFASGPRFGGQLKPLMDYLIEIYTRGEHTVIVSRQASRLEELWQEQAPVSVPSPENLHHPIFFQGSLSEGWLFTSPGGERFNLLTDGEIFGWRRPEPRRRYRAVVEAPEAAYADLAVGEWVVHVDHGVGIFMGLVNRTVEGLEREYLCVEYAGGDQLYVPVYQADRLSRYIGPDGRTPALTRLGGQEWRNAKDRTKEAVEEVAEELLELYAKRQIVEGYAFSNDTIWQQELEASFPYVETDDQLRVINEVKKDMEAARPMDRLICGDVGYGKTEVALRAAFKAVMDGKQVALLVPTTVLAQQHFNTFRERIAAFPAEVEMLSRFRTHQQQREILYRLANGAIDIIIGTHRLLQNDVQFKDLGLLIIDEEQRFGVTHKETLKQMRTEVDVLTMTATPIPRTLYMALTGARDISTINTPPEERLPIITHVGPYSPRLVRQAILRELERGGQVFFVHNRVQTIGAMRSHLERLMPEARIGVAHGQMPENDLSERMEQFSSGEVDVLLSTSIIESGLDIPNANTLIVDRADTFGLAQLYQLRGRVGRGAQRAYAYFFRHRRRLPTPEGSQRLETIAENTQLGAGYSIAMRDLEIRGTGDLLGTRQHGHIATVGFHLYTRLLANAVSRQRRQIKGAAMSLPEELPGKLPQEIRMSVNVDLPLPVGIPADYVPDKNMRLGLYRRIASLASFKEVEALAAEFADRFGPPPEEVENFLYQMKVKLLAEAASLISVSGESGQLILRCTPLPEGVVQRSFPYLGPDVRSGKNALWFQMNGQDWKERLLDILQELMERQMEK